MVSLSFSSPHFSPYSIDIMDGANMLTTSLSGTPRELQIQYRCQQGNFGQYFAPNTWRYLGMPEYG